MPVNKVKRRGSYAPLSAHYYKDDRLIRASEKAELLYVRALAFCADVLNDGFITDAQLAHVGVGLSNVKARAKALVEVGAWQRGDGGYQVVAWLAWNKSRADILDDAKKDTDRKTQPVSEQALPPEPPPDELPDEDPYRTPNDDPEEQIPNGIQAESGSRPVGFQPLAGAPVPAPSNSRAEPELRHDSAPTELALVPRAEPLPHQLTTNQRAQALARAYTDVVPMSKFPAILGIAKKALQTGHDDDTVRAALLRLADDNRPVTVDSLRIEMGGPPRRQNARPSASERAARTLALMTPEPEQTGTDG